MRYLRMGVGVAKATDSILGGDLGSRPQRQTSTSAAAYKISPCYAPGVSSECVVGCCKGAVIASILICGVR